MFAEFETHIRAHAKLPDSDFQLMCSMAIEKTLHKKQLLLKEGEVCRHKTFISNGLLRTYRTKEDGSEHIIQFAPENSWATDPESLYNLTPSCYNMEALEESEVLMWTRKDFDVLFDRIPQLKAYSERLISSNLLHSRQRIFSAISSSAEEKYEEFIQNYPGLLARVPLHMVASYLGVTPKTLSRIRHAQLKR